MHSDELRKTLLHGYKYEYYIKSGVNSSRRELSFVILHEMVKVELHTQKLWVFVSIIAKMDILLHIICIYVEILIFVYILHGVGDIFVFSGFGLFFVMQMKQFCLQHEKWLQKIINFGVIPRINQLLLNFCDKSLKTNRDSLEMLIYVFMWIDLVGNWCLKAFSIIIIT